MLAQGLNLACIEGDTPQDASCWRRPHKSICLLGELVHARLVTEDRAASALGARIYSEHSKTFLLFSHDMES